MLLMVSTMTAFAQTDQQAQTENAGDAQDTEDKELKKSYLYQWTDDKGVVHIADGLGKVPKQYRDKAVKLQQPKKEGPDQGQQVQEEPPSRDYSDEEEREEDRKIEWQQRMRAARQRLAGAESRYQELDQRRKELLQSWGGPASGHLADRIEADRIEQEMKDAQQEIDKARKDIDVVIPDEARKAGIPPGWLRE
jgi:DNA repair exonuclease SbcCD ATPase subunit